MPALERGYLGALAERLDALGVRIEPGLSDGEVAAAEREFGIRFPADLRQVLKAFLPTDSPGSRPRWPNWRSGPRAMLERRLAWPWEGIQFDLEHSDVWPAAWGPRHEKLQERIETARRLYERAPRLVPVFIHRFMPDEPLTEGSPVLSVYQTDIIIS